MDYTVKSSNPANQRTACLVLGVHEASQLTDTAQEIDQISDSYLKKTIKRSAFTGKLGQSLLLFDVPNVNQGSILLIGCGKAAELEGAKFRKLAASAAKALLDSGAKEANVCLGQVDVVECDLTWKIRQFVESMATQTYRFEQLKSKSSAKGPRLEQIIISVVKRSEVNIAEKAINQAEAIAAGVSLAKDLGNLPSNICTPSYLAEKAKQMAKGQKKLKVKILSEADMKKLKMGSLLSVSKGSQEPPKMIVFEYTNTDKDQAPTVLVGKGVTFDTGGISLKPGAGMDEMKYDMCGAASVFGTIEACVALNLPLNVVGIVPAVENMPSGTATKPGDIVTSMSGQTIEILNTDAEGRLILCDAITYSERYKPQAVIDIATLTSACVIALGAHPHGMFCNDQTLSEALVKAGEHSCDRPWPMPLWNDYQNQLDSNFADMANIGGREAGAVTAACFLWRFAKKLKWAHLDIAGTAWLKGKAKGSTGRPVPLLTQYLLDQVR